MLNPEVKQLQNSTLFILSSNSEIYLAKAGSTHLKMWDS
jgi:hypothetical protein